MEFKWLYFIIVAAIIPQKLWAQAQVYERVQTRYQHTFKSPMDYYQNSFGYDTTKSCKRPMNCLPKGSQVTCSSYTMVSRADGKVQFCNIATIDRNADGKNIQDVSDKKYSVATGYVEPDSPGFLGLKLFGKPGRYIHGLPKNEKFLADAQGQVQIFNPPNLEATVCPGPDCPESKPELPPASPKKQQPVRSFAKEMEQVAVAAAEKLSGDHAITPLHVGNLMQRKVKQVVFNPACYNFIDKEGAFGPWGIELLRAMKTVCHDCFYGEKSVDVSALCPRYKSFTPEERDLYWVYSFASMAQDEASCNDRVKARGVNGTAAGLFQLEDDYFWRKPPKRGDECSTVGGESTLSVSFQARCAVSIIRDTRWRVRDFDDKGRFVGYTSRPFTGAKGQYWHKLMSNNAKIARYIKAFPGCHNPVKPIVQEEQKTAATAQEKK